MRYEIRLAAPNADIVPLAMVADAKARFRATAGGTEFHAPTYHGSFGRFANDLLREAKSGRLRVCDQWGIPGEADALIAEATEKGDLSVVSRYLMEPDWERLHREHEPIAPGVWHFAHLDLGPSEVDWVETHLRVLATTLKWLNDWGASRGDVFTVTNDGVEWIDERGIQRPAATDDPAAAGPVPTLAGAKKSTANWALAATQGVPNPTEPEREASAAVVSKRNHVKSRAGPLAAVLAQVKQQAIDPADWQSVWAALVKLAESESRPPPLLGYVEGEGVKYRADDAANPVAYLTREALRSRFKREH